MEIDPRSNWLWLNISPTPQQQTMSTIIRGLAGTDQEMAAANIIHELIQVGNVSEIEKHYASIPFEKRIFRLDSIDQNDGNSILDYLAANSYGFIGAIDDVVVESFEEGNETMFEALIRMYARVPVEDRNNLYPPHKDSHPVLVGWSLVLIANSAAEGRDMTSLRELVWSMEHTWTDQDLNTIFEIFMNVYDPNAIFAYYFPTDRSLVRFPHPIPTLDMECRLVGSIGPFNLADPESYPITRRLLIHAKHRCILSETILAEKLVAEYPKFQSVWDSA